MEITATTFFAKSYFIAGIMFGTFLYKKLMPFVLFVGSGEIASDERSPLRGGGTQGQDFQTRGENIFLKYISDLFRS
jgi:hypothetical protein